MHDRIRRTCNAVQMVNDKMSVRRAAKTNGLSYGYLQRRLKGVTDIGQRNGPAPSFNLQEEEGLARWLVYMAESGAGVKPSDFLNFIQRIVQVEKRKTNFVNNKPKMSWYRKFMERNEHIVSVIKEMGLVYSVTAADMDELFNNYLVFIASNGDDGDISIECKHMIEME